MKKIKTIQERMETVNMQVPPVPFTANHLDFVWNTTISLMPLNKVIVVKLKNNPIPFTAIRDDDDSINYVLGPTEHGYGIYESLDDIECWMDVTP